MPIFYAIALVLGAVSVVIAYLCIIFIDVETVLGTGPAIAIMGLIVIGFATRYKHKSGMIDGISLVTIVVLTTAITWLLDWSPGEAKAPFLIIGGTYLLAQMGILITVFLNPPVLREEWQCVDCGYPIYGLQSAQCPECGSVIHPALLEKYRDSPV